MRAPWLINRCRATCSCQETANAPKSQWRMRLRALSSERSEFPVRGLPGQQGWFADLKGYLATGDYDLIQTHEDSQVTSVAVSSWARRWGVGLGLAQGMYADYTGLLESACQRAYDRTALHVLRRNCVAVTAKSEAAAAYCRRKCFVNVHVNPVGLDTYNLDLTQNVAWRSRLSVASDSRILLYIGVLEERRRPDLLVRIAEELRNRGENITLVVAGDGPLRDQTVDDAVRVLGRRFRYLERVAQSDLAGLYRAAAVTVMPRSMRYMG